MIERVPGGYRVQNTPTVHRTKRQAMRQLQAIKIQQSQNDESSKQWKKSQ